MFECKKMSNWKLPKWAVVLAAALLFVPLVADWVAPGAGARLAEHMLREVKVGGEGEQRMLFPLWSWLVGLAGRDVGALGAISAAAGLVCVWLVALIFGAIFGAAVRGAKAGGVKGEEGNYAGVESAAVLLAGLACGSCRYWRRCWWDCRLGVRGSAGIMTCWPMSPKSRRSARNGSTTPHGFGA